MGIRCVGLGGPIRRERKLQVQGTWRFLAQQPAMSPTPEWAPMRGSRIVMHRVLAEPAAAAAAAARGGGMRVARVRAHGSRAAQGLVHGVDGDLEGAHVGAVAVGQTLLAARLELPARRRRGHATFDARLDGVLLQLHEQRHLHLLRRLRSVPSREGPRCGETRERGAEGGVVMGEEGEGGARHAPQRRAPSCRDPSRRLHKRWG